jgi:eukaryotic-like serine/threonine-protein kinase
MATTSVQLEAGATLGKYQLHDRVGQGGMSVVYRAVDQSLGRDVAVKVLHRHLADSQEARDRFAREARAVAKLRHPNILEIYDYSGSADGRDDASYIVTEFIDGETLKQFITREPLQFPEVAAMIVVHIADALAHAHEAKILHRDIKPENVMIRRDGAVKLMDFGISHMVDLERLTVTGQLLGSPAYMAPEHVDGKPIDFRTDIFALGTVLYQLCTGQLPFTGKNAHEVLKRIVEGRCTDARQLTPSVGNQLGRIILRAMAVVPDDRYQTVIEFRSALMQFLDDSGIDNPSEKLATFFASPAHFNEGFRPQLVAHLAKRGKRLLPDQQTSALDAFDRVLAMDPGNTDVLATLHGVQRRRKLKSAALAVAGLGIAVAGTVAVWKLMNHNGFEGREVLGSARPDAGRPVTDASAPVMAMATDARVVDAKLVMALDAAAADVRHSIVRDPPRALDAAPAIRIAKKTLVTISPPSSEYRLDDGDWQTTGGGRIAVDVTDGPVRVAVRNDKCCEAKSRIVGDADDNETVMIALAFLPAQLTPTCAKATSVRIDGRMASLNQAALIPFGETTQTTRQVVVEFVGDGIEKQTITLRPADNREVPCVMH